MDSLNKMCSKTGIIVILVMLNMACLTMIFIGMPRPLGPEILSRIAGDGRLKTMLRKELAFSDSQAVQYLRIRKEFQTSADEVDERLRFLKRQMFDLAVQENAPAEPSDSLSRISLAEQRELDVLMYRHLRALGQMCTPEQRVKLNHLFHQLTRKPPDRMGPPPDHD